MFVLTIASAAGRSGPEAVKLLSASHVALVTVQDGGQSRGKWNPVDISIDQQIKGEWRAGISVWIPEGTEGLKSGGKYLVFCSEKTTRDRGVTLFAYWEDVIAVRGSESAMVLDRVSRIAQEQRDALSQALKTTMLKPPPDGDVSQILAMLFQADTQREAVRLLLALPEEANRALAMHVYDTRPIPRNLLSPDAPIVFHSSPVIEGRCVQEIAAWVLGLRMSRSFGAFDEASVEKRMAIADAWFYWVMAEK